MLPLKPSPIAIISLGTATSDSAMGVKVGTLESKRPCISGNTFTVTVSDNGIGLAAENLSPVNQLESPRHNGLVNIKSRMGAIGGRYEINSLPGKGTTVWLQITLLPSQHVEN